MSSIESGSLPEFKKSVDSDEDEKFEGADEQQPLNINASQRQSERASQRSQSRGGADPASVEYSALRENLARPSPTSGAANNAYDQVTPEEPQFSPPKNKNLTFEDREASSAPEAHKLASSRLQGQSPSQSNQLRETARSRKARQSLPPGSILDNSNFGARFIFRCITDNDHRKLQIFLDDKGGQVDVVEVQESRQYSALAYAAFKNHTHCFRVIYAHGCKYNLPLGPDLQPTTKALQAWANQRTDEDFTALHFATYHGSYELIQLITETMKADFRAKNIYGANVLHIAAQGDQPAPLYYFARIKDMDINETDNRGSTPLHWACYSRSEFALSYILALSPELEIQDQAGFTPLHLAIKSVGELKSTRPVRALLLKGASRDARNLKEESCNEMIRDNVPENMKRELKSMLKKPTYVECCMVKTPLVPLRQNHKTQILFVVLFLVILSAQLFIIIPNQKFPEFAYLISFLSIILAVSFFMATVSDPGYLEPKYHFMELLSKVHPCEMCPDCEVLRTPRSKHCAICNRCVDRFDHHCPWINNCVGIHNHNSFFVFVITLILILMLIIASSITTLADECHPRTAEGVDNCPLIEMCVGCKILWLRYLVLIVTTLVALFFGGPASLLLYVHVMNYSNGKTTNERMAKNARTVSEAIDNASQSQSGMSSTLDPEELIKRKRAQKAGCCGNCFAMCFKKQVPSQEDMLLIYQQENTGLSSATSMTGQ